VLTVAAVALGLAFNGAGAWSLDAAIGWQVAGVVWGLATTGVALVAGAAPARASAPHRGFDHRGRSRCVGRVTERHRTRAPRDGAPADWMLSSAGSRR
jgi:hypothetical protein